MKHDADGNDFAEFAETMTTEVTKLINAQMYLSVQAVEKDTWQEVTALKLKKIKDNLKKGKLIAEWEDGELFKFCHEKMSLQDQTLSHTLNISDVKWIQKLN